jgi:hypothetical protein
MGPFEGDIINFNNDFAFSVNYSKLRRAFKPVARGEQKKKNHLNKRIRQLLCMSRCTGVITKTISKYFITV